MARIPRKVDVPLARLNDKGPPWGSHLIKDASRLAVLALNKMHGGSAHSCAVNPVEFNRLVVTE